MATRQPVIADPASHRTVVMLRGKERQRLNALARDENVSTGEIIRRAILAYDPDREDEEALRPLVELWRESTDRAIDSVTQTVTEVNNVRARVEALLD